MNNRQSGGSVPIVVIYYTGIGCDPLPHLHSPDRFLIIMNEHFKEDNPEKLFIDNYFENESK